MKMKSLPNIESVLVQITYEWKLQYIWFHLASISRLQVGTKIQIFKGTVGMIFSHSICGEKFKALYDQERMR